MEIVRVRGQLHQLDTDVPGGSGDGEGKGGRRSALLAELKEFRVQRFRGWLICVKGVADLICSTTMPGPEVRRRFPALCAWMNDGVVSMAGLCSALIVCFNRFPSPSPSPSPSPANG